MGKMEETLREEIARLARKELRPTIDSLSREMRELKRTIARLVKTVDVLKKAVDQNARPGLATASPDQTSRGGIKAPRITAKSIKGLRKKLGITQERLAILLNVSTSTVAFWEQKRAMPRGKNRAALLTLRKLGRKDIKRILAEKGITDGKKTAAKKGSEKIMQ